MLHVGVTVFVDPLLIVAVQLYVAVFPLVTLDAPEIEIDDRTTDASPAACVTVKVFVVEAPLMVMVPVRGLLVSFAATAYPRAPLPDEDVL